MISGPFSFLRNKPFVANLSWSFLGGIGSALLLLFATVLAGRLLGPVEYGKFAAITAVADIIGLFLIFGMDKSSMRLLAMRDDRQERSQLISFTFFFFLVLAATLALLYWLFSPFLSRLLSLPVALLGVAFAYAVVASLRQIANNFIRSLDKFRYQAFARLAEGLLVLGLFLLLYRAVAGTYQSYAWAVITAGVVIILLFLFHIRAYFTRSVPHYSRFMDQLSHARIYFFAAVLGILFGSLDKIIIGKYLGFHDLGIYAAYSTVALSFTAQLNSMLGNVFFPMFSKKLAQFRMILRMVDRISLFAFFPMMIVVGTVIIVVMHFFGGAYAVNAWYVIGFSILAVVRMLFSFNAMLVDIFSKETLKSAMLLGNLSNLFFAGFFLVLVKVVGLSIPLVVAVLIIYNIAATAICKFSLYKKGAYHATLQP